MTAGTAPEEEGRGMNELRAVLFGIETLVDTSDVARKAYNLVFEEAGLPWRWDVTDYARLCRLSPGDDILDVFIRFERPFWRNSEDMKHLLAAVRRRHASLCCSSVSDLADPDTDMLAVVEAARKTGLKICAITSATQASPRLIEGIASADTYDDAVMDLDVPARECIAIAGTAEGLQAAADAGIVALDKLAISANARALGDAAILALLAEVHANVKPANTRPRLFATALFA